MCIRRNLWDWVALCWGVGCPHWTGLGGSPLDWGNQRCSELQCPTVSQPTLRRAAFFVFSGYFLVLQESDRKYSPCQGIPH